MALAGGGLALAGGGLALAGGGSALAGGGLASAWGGGGGRGGMMAVGVGGLWFPLACPLEPVETEGTFAFVFWLLFWSIRG